MVQIGSEVFEDLTPETFETNRLIDDLDAGRPVKPGPQVARHLSEPEGGPTTLTDPSLYAAAAKPAAAPGCGACRSRGGTRACQPGGEARRDRRAPWRQG